MGKEKIDLHKEDIRGYTPLVIAYQQKHFDCDWIPQINYGAEATRQKVPTIDQVLGNKYNPAQATTNAGTDSVKKFLKSVGL